MSKPVSLWVTKYALTQGIQRVDCTIKERYAYSTGKYHTQYPPGDWHRTEGDAITRAEEMRTAKLRSLEKQIAKIRALRFKP